MASLFSKPKFPDPTPSATSIAAAPPTVADAPVQQAAQDLRVNEAQAKGRGSTILTSGLGDVSQPTLEKKKLLGATA